MSNYAPTAMTMRVTTETSDQSVILRMQVQLLYGPEILIDVEPDTAVYVRLP
jgi:hypothetical protein